MHFEIFQTHCRVDSYILILRFLQNIEIHLKKPDLELLLFLAFELVSRLHDRGFHHWVVSMVWGFPTVATLIHIDHFQNLLFDKNP